MAVPVRRKLLGLFSSGTFFVLGAYILIIDGAIELDTVIRALLIAGAGAAIAGSIGFIMGKVIEAPVRHDTSSDDYYANSDSDLLIDDVMIDELKNIK